MNGLAAGAARNRVQPNGTVSHNSGELLEKAHEWDDFNANDADAQVLERTMRSVTRVDAYTSLLIDWAEESRREGESAGP